MAAAPSRPVPVALTAPMSDPAYPLTLIPLSRASRTLARVIPLVQVPVMSPIDKPWTRWVPQTHPPMMPQSYPGYAG